MTDTELKRWESSKDSPTYFSKNEVLIRNHRGLMPFELYDHQRNLMKRLLQRDHYIISKARQMGISTALLVYGLWKILFNSDYKVVWLSVNTGVAHHHAKILQDIYDRLDDIFKQGLNQIDKKSKTSFSIQSGSGITFIPSSTNPHTFGMGGLSNIDLLIGDEIAYINNFDEWADSFEQLIKPDGSMVLASTPNSTSTWFDGTFMRALRGQNKFVPMQLDWTLHPNWDDDWRRNQDNNLGRKIAELEYDGSVREIQKEV